MRQGTMANAELLVCEAKEFQGNGSSKSGKALSMIKLGKGREGWIVYRLFSLSRDPPWPIKIKDGGRMYLVSDANINAT